MLHRIRVFFITTPGSLFAERYWDECGRARSKIFRTAIQILIAEAAELHSVSTLYCSILLENSKVFLNHVRVVFDPAYMRDAL